MAPRLRPYKFYDTAVSICSTCYRRVDAKIVFMEGAVWMLKRCPQHGGERVLLADDIDYYRRAREPGKGLNLIFGSHSASSSWSLDRKR